MKTTYVLGRLIFGGFFLYNGIHHFKEYKSMAAYAAAKGVPQPEAAILGTGALLTFGGASVLLGVKPRLGGLAIATFLAGVSPKMHDFWNETDPMQKQNNMAHFMKNMALLGGALTLMGRGETRSASRERSPVAEEKRHTLRREANHRHLERAA